MKTVPCEYCPLPPIHCVWYLPQVVPSDIYNFLTNASVTISSIPWLTQGTTRCSTFSYNMNIIHCVDTEKYIMYISISMYLSVSSWAYAIHNLCVLSNGNTFTFQYVYSEFVVSALYN